MHDLCVQPSHIYYGPGSLKELPVNIHHPAAVLCREEDILPEVLRRVSDENTHNMMYFPGIVPELSCVRTVSEKLISAGIRTVIAVGAVPELDASKAIRIFAESPDTDIASLESDGSGCCPSHSIPLIVIPTTADTATGVTRYGVISDLGRPYFCSHASMVPDCVIMDPDILQAMESDEIAVSALDSFVNALESYVSSASQPMMENYALEALQITDSLFREHISSSKTALEKLMYAHCLGSLAFSNGQLGAAHALAHASQGAFSIPMPHGAATSIALRHVLDHNKEACRDRFKKVLSYLGIGYSCDPADALATRLAQYMSEARIPDSISGFGIKEDEFREKKGKIISTAMHDGCMKWNPVPVSMDDAAVLLNKMYKGE